VGAVKVTSVELNKEKIKKLFIELIKEDNEVKDILADILSTDLATKKDIIDLTIAIKNLREDFNREMIALRNTKGHARRIRPRLGRNQIATGRDGPDAKGHARGVQ